MLQERGLVLLGGGEEEEEEVTQVKIVHDHRNAVVPNANKFRNK